MANAKNIKFIQGFLYIPANFGKFFEEWGNLLDYW